MNTRTLIMDVTFGLSLGLGVLLWQNVHSSEASETSLHVEKVYSIQDAEGAVQVCEALDKLAFSSDNDGSEVGEIAAGSTKWHCYVEESITPPTGRGIIGVSTDDAAPHRIERFDI